MEYQLPGVVQIPVNEKKGTDVSGGLRSILRHDPDKIMVGEIRDAETAQIAIQSALTGHLVLTTVHANNVFDVIGRFASMGIDSFLQFPRGVDLRVGATADPGDLPGLSASGSARSGAGRKSGLDYDEFKGAPFCQKEKAVRSATTPAIEDESVLPSSWI